MRFGLALPSFSFPDLDYAEAARLRDFAIRAEAGGYESLWVVEHLLTARGLYVTFGHLNFMHIVPTDDAAAAARVQRPLIERVMGTHRSFDHLQSCYFLGTPTRIRQRIAELQGAGLEYLVLSPLDYDLDQFDLWEEEIIRHFRAG
jgi:alkanesulfonate monooxygenase SsuD/methylene tetrahydromethanopterin reductase-like flavin-dependent oxidoreductase (luciferase family)